jgi:acyl transferase domain-containing protein
MALAGGVTIEIPHGQGYIYRDGEILSRDGHCRSFDALATGTVFGSGVSLVVLRRLEDALEDRDVIRAVILGSAINNDGARKVGYLSPSVEGQAEVIAEALEFAGVSADNISYIEAHGTGTVVGDPIEIRALTQA